MAPLRLDRSEEVAWLEIDDPSGAGRARRRATELAAQLGFGSERAGEVGLAVTEVVTNLYHHGGGGSLALRRLERSGRAALEVVAVDTGPGMADPLAWARDGRSTTGTLGVGIGSIRRLADRFVTWSAPGRGTVVAAGFWADRPAPDPDGSSQADGLVRPMKGQEMSGDGWAQRRVAAGLQVLVSDGLGHGPMAAAASQEAVRAFHDAPAASPAEVMTHLHTQLSHTRGAAAAVVEVAQDEGLLTLAGVGNVAVWIEVSGQRRGLLCRPGIVGHQTPVIRQESVRLGPDSLIILHSDGLSGRWSLDDYPGLRQAAPVVVAAVLMRDWGTHRDDASVVVIRPS